MKQDKPQLLLKHYLKNARFPITKTLDTFDFKAQPSIKQKLIRELMVGQYVERREYVLFVGNSGTGKAHLARALGFAGRVSRGPQGAVLHGGQLGQSLGGDAQTVPVGAILNPTGQSRPANM